MNQAIAILTVINQPFYCDGKPMGHLKKGTHHILYRVDPALNDDNLPYYIKTRNGLRHYVGPNFLDSYCFCLMLTAEQSAQFVGL